MLFYNSSFFGDASLSAYWSICSKILVPTGLDYDRLNRLTGTEYGEEDFAQAKGRYDDQLRYDADGNVQALVRNGRKQNGAYGPVDDLKMSYDGCRLSAVEKRASPGAVLKFLQPFSLPHDITGRT